ncbi:MAG TPA: hypothetical protein VKF32_07995, partial [Thermoanaerobaculia bacterium]|nr:hypothetical protein [Thermoanaerobaculia bacterium]
MRPFASVPVTALALLGIASSAPAQLGSEFRANTYTTGAQRHPAVAASAGTFLVVWESPQDGSSYGIYGQRFTSASKPLPLGTEFLVNTVSTAGPQRYPATAVDGSGNFVVVWQSSPFSTFTIVYGRRINSAGVPVGPEFRVSTNTAGGYIPRRPAVA